MLNIKTITAALVFPTTHPKASAMSKETQWLTLNDTEFARIVFAQLRELYPDWLEQQVDRGQEIADAYKVKVAALFSNLSAVEKKLITDKEEALAVIRKEIAAIHTGPLKKAERDVALFEARQVLKETERLFDAQNTRTIRDLRSDAKNRSEELFVNLKDDSRAAWYGVISVGVTLFEKRVRNTILVTAKKEVDILINDISYSQIGMSNTKVTHPVSLNVRAGITRDDRIMPAVSEALEVLHNVTAIFIPAEGREESSSVEVAPKKVDLKGSAIFKAISCVLTIAQSINATKPSTASRKNGKLVEYVPSNALSEIIDLAYAAEDAGSNVSAAEYKMTETRNALRRNLLRQAGLRNAEPMNIGEAASFEIGAKAYKTLVKQRLMDMAADSGDIKLHRTIAKRVREIETTHANVLLAEAKAKAKTTLTLPVKTKEQVAAEVKAERTLKVAEAAKRNLAVATRTLDAIQAEGPRETIQIVVNHLQGTKGVTSHDWIITEVGTMIHARAVKQAVTGKKEDEVRSFKEFNTARIDAMQVTSFIGELKQALKEEALDGVRHTLKKVVRFIKRLETPDRLKIRAAREQAMARYAEEAANAYDAVQTAPDSDETFELVRIGSLRRIDQLLSEDPDVVETTQCFIDAISRMLGAKELTHHTWLSKLEGVLPEVDGLSRTLASEIEAAIDALKTCDLGAVVSGGHYVYTGIDAGKEFHFKATSRSFNERSEIVRAGAEEMNIEDFTPELTPNSDFDSISE